MSDDDLVRSADEAVVPGQLLVGTVFAGYRVERVLGWGGMGTVYIAQHPRLPRRDVLKLLNPSLSQDASFRARFAREADLAGSLEHRNIVAVYDRGVFDGQLWLAMRYVRGSDAASLLRRQPQGVDPAFAVHVIAEIGNGLDYAHRRRLVHRDVKPANILIEEEDGVTGGILLTDFGIARAVDDAAHLTDTGLTVASVPYASPEQLEGHDLDGRADIYALGCTFVELLTGSPPYPRDNRLAAMSAHLNSPPPSLRERDPSLPPGLDQVIATVLAKEPDRRYPTCRAFVDAAAAAFGLPSPGASPPSGPFTDPMNRSGPLTGPGSMPPRTGACRRRTTPPPTCPTPRHATTRGPDRFQVRHRTACSYLLVSRTMPPRWCPDREPCPPTAHVAAVVGESCCPPWGSLRSPLSCSAP